MIANKRPRAQRGFTLIELMIVIAIIAILAAVLVPNFIRARSMGQLTACKGNLRNMATALEAYSVDHGGHYPASISVLTPNYLKSLPECPTAASVTYKDSYTFTLNPDTYAFFCEGTFHTALALPVDHPAWDSGTGLQER